MSDDSEVAGRLPGLPGWRELLAYVPGMLVRVLLPCVAIVAFFSIPFGERPGLPRTVTVCASIIQCSTHGD